MTATAAVAESNGRAADVRATGEYMDSTDPKKTKEPADKVSGGNSPESSEPTKVPVAAIAAEREKKREATDKAEKLEAEVAAMREELEKLRTQKPAGDMDDVRKTLSEIQDREYRRNLSASLGLDDKQTGIVAELGKNLPGLNPTELLSLAATRNPDAFKSRGQNGFDPSVHGSMRPSPGAGGEPPKSDFQERIKTIRESKDKVLKSQLENNLIGSFAAKAMGWEHKKLPIE